MTMQQIPYIVYEAERHRQERHSRRLLAALGVAALLLVGSNIAWAIVFYCAG